MDIAQATFASKVKFNNPAVRRYFVKKLGLIGFCLVYLRHYFYAEPANFHYLLCYILSSIKEELVGIIGFRGSAKSTLATLALPLYESLEHLHDFIILVGDTTTQSDLNIANIRYELENNEALIEDYGIMFSKATNWSSGRLILTNGVMIMGRSRGQKMRGLRHRQYRPQVVICDDLEDLEWVKKKVNRNKTETWFNAEVIPAQQEDKSKLVVIGNLLHKDALMRRLKKRKRANGKPLFKFYEFALFDKRGRVTWRGKYPTKEAVQKQKEKVNSPTAWAREYELKIISEDDQVIKETDIHRYKNSLPDQFDEQGKKIHTLLDSGVGVDFAISEDETADFTAMVGGKKYLLKEIGERILVMPNPVNKQIGFDATLKEAEKLNAVMPYGNKWYPEDVGYQKSAIQTMKRKGFSVYPMKAVSDKKARLEAVSPFIIDGTVMFPEYGCEELIEQLVGFGTEEHDDLVDALVYMIMGMLKRKSFKVSDRPDKI